MHAIKGFRAITHHEDKRLCDLRVAHLRWRSKSVFFQLSRSYSLREKRCSHAVTFFSALHKCASDVPVDFGNSK